MYRSQLQYLIRWTGYDPLRWEPTNFVDGLQWGRFTNGIQRSQDLCKKSLEDLGCEEGILSRLRLRVMVVNGI